MHTVGWRPNRTSRFGSDGVLCRLGPDTCAVALVSDEVNRPFMTLAMNIRCGAAATSGRALVLAEAKYEMIDILRRGDMDVRPMASLGGQKW